MQRIYKYFISFILGAGFLFCCFACNPGKNSGGRKPAGVLNQSVDGWKLNPRLDETARLLAGREQKPGSRLLELSESKSYRRYARRVGQMWERYREKHAARVSAWRVKNLPAPAEYTDVLYPFSGPDITNALLFFPGARNYVLMGLEFPANFPEPDPGSPGRVLSKLHLVPQAAGGSLRRIFFKTINMAEVVGESDYNGVAAIMMFFVSGLGYEIVDGYRSTIDENGKSVRDAYFYRVKSKKAKGKMKRLPAPKIKGFTMFFRKDVSSPVRRVTYHRYSISDSSMNKQKRMQKYLSALNPGVTMLKSASYLLYHETFDDMRSVVLQKSKYILTDTSGIPFYYINNANWEKRYFGLYKKPIGMFRDRHEPELVREMKEHPPGEIDFEYGYRSKAGEAHIIFATRSENYPFQDPIFDGGREFGFESVYKPGMDKMIRIDRHITPFVRPRKKKPPRDNEAKNGEDIKRKSKGGKSAKKG